MPFRAFRWAAWVIVGSGALVGLVVAVANHPGAQRWLLGRALPLLEKRARLTIRLDHFRWDLPGGRIRLAGLELRTDPGSPAFLRIEQAEISLQYWRWGDPVRAVKATGVTLDVSRLPSGEWNLPAAEGGSREPVALPALMTLRDVTVLLNDAPVHACLRDLSIDVRHGQLRVTAASAGALGLGRLGGQFNRLQFEGVLKKATLAGLQGRGTIAATLESVPELGRVQATAEFVLDGAKERISFLALQAASAPVTASVAGFVSLRDETSQASATLRAQGAVLKGRFQWPGVNLAAATGEGTLTLQRFDSRGAGRFQLLPDRLVVQIAQLSGWGTQLRGSVELRRDRLALSGKLTGAYALAAPSLQGAIQYRASLGGAVTDPRAALTVAGELTLGPLQAVRVAAEAQASLRAVEIPRASANWRGQELTGSAKIDLTPRRPQLAATFQGGSLAIREFAEALAAPVPVDGQLSVAGRLTGQINDPELDLLVEGTQLCAYQEELGALRARATYRSGFVEVPELELLKTQTTGTGRLTASGWVDLPDETFRLDLAAANLRVESLRPEDLGLTGAAKERLEFQLVAEAAVAGTFAEPRGKASLSAVASGVERFALHAGLDHGQVTIAANAQGVDLSSYGWPVRFQAGAALEAPLRDWRRASGRVTVEGLTAEIDNVRLAAKGPIEIGLADQTLEARRVLFESADAALAVRGRLPWDQPRAEATLKLAGAMPLSFVQQFLPPELDAKLSGSVVLAGEVAGSLHQPQPLVTLQTEGAEARFGPLREALSDIELRITATRDSLRLDRFRAGLLGGILEATARLPLPKGEASAELRFMGLDPLRLTGEPSGTLRSRVSGVLTATAAPYSLDGVAAEARLTELLLLSPKDTLAQREETQLTLRRGLLSLDRFRIQGQASELRAGGTLSLQPGGPLNLRVDGIIDPGMFSPAAGNFGAAGPVEAHVAIQGSLAEPLLTGDARWRKGQLFVASPPLSFDNLEAAIRLDGRRMQIQSLTGTLNGGRLEGQGRLTVQGKELADVSLALSGRGLYLDFPRGFRTASNADLTLQSRARTLVLGGEVNILDGSYQEAIDLAWLTRGRNEAPSLVSEPIPYLENLRFDLALRTRQPVLIDNNFGRLLADANLRLRGTPTKPALTGRLEIGDEGRIYFSGRTFNVTSGIIDFTDETAIAPRFNLAAETRIANYDIILRLTGEAGNVRTTFSAEPSANEDQILSLLFTGSVDNVGRGAAYAQAQLLTLFGSSLTGGLATRLRNTLGLSEFRIDPGILSPDSDPTARLTLGQNVTPELKLTYSTNLADSQDQIWIAEYDWRRRFLARYFRQTDQSNRLELRQKLRFGGGDQTGDFSIRPPRRRIPLAGITITGSPQFSEALIRQKLGLRVGRNFDFLRTQRGIERLKNFYADRGYAEVRIQQDRREDHHALYLTLDIDAGEPVRFMFEGDDPGKRARRQLQAVWRQGLMEQQRLRTATEALRQHYLARRYPDARLDAEVKPLGGFKTVVFHIQRGPRYGRPEIVFETAPEGLTGDLIAALRQEGLDRLAQAAPDQLAQFLSRYLGQRGYLAARVDRPRIETREKTIRLTVPMFAGPRFQVGKITFDGVRSIAETELIAALPVQAGDLYIPEDRYTVARRIQQLYWNRGYRRADVDVEPFVQTSTGRVDLKVKVQENVRYEVAAVEVKGLSQTTESFVRRRLALAEGEPLSAEKLNISRRNLLDSGAYNIIDFTYPPLGTPAAGGVQPVALQVNVREPKPYRFDYGVTYDTARGVGALIDLSTQNVFQEARTVGFRTVTDARRQEYRGYFNQPFLGRHRIGTNATVFHTRDRFPVLDDLNFDIRTTGATLQQYVQFGPRFSLNYGYRVDRAGAVARFAGQPFDAARRTSQLVIALSRDTRDNALDATRGSFLSTTVEHAPSWLGGDVTFTRFYQQAFHYFGLSKPERMPFEGEQRRSRLVYATALRIGAITGDQGNLFLPIDFFFAGGGTSIRGYEQNSIGPGIAGGRATLVLNNELRFPLFKFLDGVGFLDAGNVWERASGINLGDLRTGAGAGLRIRNPFVVLRFDYGWKLARRPGESAGGFFFSIGQAF